MRETREQEQVAVSAETAAPERDIRDDADAMAAITMLQERGYSPDEVCDALASPGATLATVEVDRG